MQELKEYLNMQKTFDPPYILTPEQENQAIEWAIKQERDKYIYNRTKKVDPNISSELMTIRANEIISDANKMQFAIDKVQVLKTANVFHYWDAVDKKNKAERVQKEIEAAEILKKQWNARTMYRFLRHQTLKNEGFEFIYHEHVQNLVKSMCYFLSRDERFVTELGYDFKKGILIKGQTGLGKTLVVKSLSENKLRHISIHSMIDINNAISKEGEYFIGPNKVVYIDDVGSGASISEATQKRSAQVNYYGTKINWFANFIESYYFNAKSKDFSSLIISTNESPQGFEELFGFRVRSRCAEMFNVVNVDGDDLRKSINKMKIEKLE